MHSYITVLVQPTNFVIFFRNQQSTMSLKLITLAALGAAAQASVADPGADQIVANAMEAVAIVASHTRRQLDSRFLATTPYMKAKCIKGYALKRTFPLMDLKFSTSVIIPTTGYCIKGKASAVGYFKLTCDGTFLFYFLRFVFFSKILFWV